jgi:hypothetical protein
MTPVKEKKYMGAVASAFETVSFQETFISTLGRSKEGAQ